MKTFFSLYFSLHSLFSSVYLLFHGVKVHLPIHRHRYMVSPERTFGSQLPDGSWTGMMGMVVREVSKPRALQSH